MAELLVLLFLYWIVNLFNSRARATKDFIKWSRKLSQRLSSFETKTTRNKHNTHKKRKAPSDDDDLFFTDLGGSNNTFGF